MTKPIKKPIEKKNLFWSPLYHHFYSLMENKAFFNIVRPRPRSFFSRPISKCITWLVGWENLKIDAVNVETLREQLSNGKQKGNVTARSRLCCNVNCEKDSSSSCFYLCCQSIFMAILMRMTRQEGWMQRHLSSLHFHFPIYSKCICNSSSFHIVWK